MTSKGPVKSSSRLDQRH